MKKRPEVDKGGRVWRGITREIKKLNLKKNPEEDKGGRGGEELQGKLRN